MISVTKCFEFEAAHYLPFYKGACHNQHGHSYRLEIEVSGPLQDDGPDRGMIVDFKLLKQTVMSLIVNKMDHKNLNTMFDNPTAEIMVGWIAIELDKKTPEGITLSRVRLWETSSSYAEWRRD